MPALFRQPHTERRIYFVAQRIDPINPASRLALEMGVEPFFEPIPAARALHLEGREILSREVRRFDFGLGSDIAERVGGRRSKRIRADVRRINLEWRLDRQSLDEPGVLDGFEVLHQRVGQKELGFEMTVQVFRRHLLIAAEDTIHLVQVTLYQRGPGNLLKLAVIRHILVARRPVVVADANVFAMQLRLQFIEVQQDRKAMLVADEQLAVAIIDVAAWSGKKNPPLILLPLRVGMLAGLSQLLVGQPDGEDEEEAAEDEIEKDCLLYTSDAADE